MSDAHKRQTEYIIRAADDAGHRTKVEARSRTKKAINSGLDTSIWFNDRENLPAWFFHVPSVGMNRLPWDVQLPAARSATATTGLRKIRAVRCGSAEVPLCPDRRTQRSRSCNSFHAAHEPWLGMTVDDVAAMTPVGEIVALSYRGKEVLLVEPASRDLYQQLVGRLPSTQQARPDRVIRTEDRVECMAPGDLLEPSHDPTPTAFG